jgi:Raf kinase inhibitor-like YbhB/YbcL family protein
MHLTSPAFSAGGSIPRKYSCDGEDISPPLEWRHVPDRTKSFVIIFEDPDVPAGPFTHWVLYNIAPTITRIEEGDVFTGTPGTNSFGTTGYRGPCPPADGPAHHYVFHVYALDMPEVRHLELRKDDLIDAMEGHILDEGELVAEYGRADK